VLSWPYVHLLINHFPVVLTVAGLVAALGGILLHRRGLWLYAMGTLTVAGVIVYPVHFTGDQADRALHDPWYIKPGVIDAHDSVAGLATFVIILCGLVCAYAWWRTLRRPAEPIPVWIRSAVLIGAIAGFGTVVYTAYLGGKIVHEAPVLGLPQAPAGLPPGIVTPSSDTSVRQPTGPG
jgi:uncharacterized membrane protein